VETAVKTEKRDDKHFSSLFLPIPPILMEDGVNEVNHLLY